MIGDIMRRAQDVQLQLSHKKAEEAQKREEEEEEEMRQKRENARSRATELWADPTPLGYRRVRWADDYVPGKTLELLAEAGVVKRLRSGDVFDYSQRMIEALADQILQSEGPVATVKVVVRAWHWRELPKPANYKHPWPKFWLHVEIASSDTTDTWSYVIDANDLRHVFWTKIVTSLEDAAAFLHGCVRDELRDAAFSDVEVYWLKNGVQVATGYFGRTSEVSGAGWSFDGDQAWALRGCGTVGVIENNE